MRFTICCALLLISSMAARGDSYSYGPPPTDSLIVSYGPACAAGFCTFLENWSIAEPDSGVSVLLSTGLPLPQIAAPVPGEPFSIITTITDSFAPPACAVNQFLCDYAYIFGHDFTGEGIAAPYGSADVQAFAATLPDYSVVNSSYLTWLSDPPPVATPEPSTNWLLICGMGFSAILYAAGPIRKSGKKS